MAILKINRSDFVQALTMEVENHGGGWYLDTESGEILLDCDGAEDLPEDLEDNPRYRAIGSVSSHDSFRIMEKFVDDLGDAKQARSLRNALDRPKPFRRFKDTLYDYPQLPEAWFAFQEKELARVAEEWCEENGIEVEWV